MPTRSRHPRRTETTNAPSMRQGKSPREVHDVAQPLNVVLKLCVRSLLLSSLLLSGHCAATTASSARESVRSTAHCASNKKTTAYQIMCQKCTPPRSQNCAKRRENNEIYTFAPACTAVLQYCNTRTDVTWAMGGAGGVALAICAPAHASCTPHECVMYHQLRTVLRSCARSCVRTVLHARGLACAWSCVHACVPTLHAHGLACTSTVDVLS